MFWQLLIVDFVRNWKARRNSSGLSVDSTPATSSHKPVTPPFSPEPQLEKSSPQLLASSARKYGPGSIEMQELKTSDSISEEKRDWLEGKAVNAAALAMGKRASVEQKLLSEDEGDNIDL